MLPNHREIVKLSKTKAYAKLDVEIFNLVSVIAFYEIERFIYSEAFKGTGLGLCSQWVALMWYSG